MLVESHSKMPAKKARRNAKSSLTRRCNNLISMIENNRPLEEVTEALQLVEVDYKAALQLVEVDYKTAVTKHEELVEKIEKTLTLKCAKDYILKLKEGQ